MAVLVVLIIFIILAAVLYWLSNCGSFTGTDFSMLQALFSAAALMYFVFDLFSSSSWVWKIIDILIIILILFMYWSITRQCRFFNRL